MRMWEMIITQFLCLDFMKLIIFRLGMFMIAILYLSIE